MDNLQIKGTLTSRIEIRSKNNETYYYAFFKSPNLVDPEAEFPVIFKGNKPNLTKGSQVQLTGQWAKGKDRASFTCLSYKIKPNYQAQEVVRG